MINQTKKIVLLFLFLFSFFFVINSCKKDEYKNLDCSTISSSYKNNIAPIISSNCLSSGCHNAGSGNADYTTYSGLKAVADNGKLDARALEDKNMPPSGALSLDDRKKIKCWLNSGAPNN